MYENLRNYEKAAGNHVKSLKYIGNRLYTEAYLISNTRKNTAEHRRSWKSSGTTTHRKTNHRQTTEIVEHI